MPAEDDTREWLTTVYHVLADPQRQRLIEVLDNEGGTLDIDQLAYRVAGGDHATADSIRLSIIHKHLPLLADADLVNVDADPVVATSTSRLETVVDAHRAMQEVVADEQ